MHINKKLTITASLFGAMALSIAASMPQDREPPKLVNLKVFPKNIPYRVLDHTMDIWSASLGVRCNFCHVRDAQTNKMDFASDAKPEKKAAREMFKMTAKINSKYFEGKKDSIGLVMGDIKCLTCHRGNPHPDEVKDMGGMDMMHHGDMHAPGAGPGAKRDSVPPPGK